jgi:hypothetical protein
MKFFFFEKTYLDLPDRPLRLDAQIVSFPRIVNELEGLVRRIPVVPSTRRTLIPKLYRPGLIVARRKTDRRKAREINSLQAATPVLPQDDGGVTR